MEKAVVGAYARDPIQLTDTMRARDGGDAESSIVWRRKVKPEESKDFHEGVVFGFWFVIPPHS